MTPRRPEKSAVIFLKRPPEYSDNLMEFWRRVMKRYYIKCRSGRIEYFDIIREIEDGYVVRLTRISDGNKKIIEESMTRHLFDICLKTGYIYKDDRAVVA
jgi:hypothetical protein